jgi:secreted PhoX family phosphatase
MKTKLLALAIGTACAATAGAADFGQKVEALLKAQSLSLFGVISPLSDSSTTQITGTAAQADPTKLVTLAAGLTARVVSEADGLGGNMDQMILWPDAVNPTHLIACNEEGTAAPGVQRIRLSDGAVETILTGLNRCDPLRKTPWGTIIAAEENGLASRFVEIINPLNTTGVTISGTVLTGTDAGNIAVRTALGAFSFEGIAILPSGVTYYSDENRPGTAGLGGPGGSQMKFIPSAQWTPGNPAITSLAQSPYTAGRIFGLRIGKNSNNTDVGQGNEFGRGVWVELVEGQVIGTTTIARSDLRGAASALKLTAYYRPEDIDIDLKALDAGNVRFCGTNTGQDLPVASGGDNHWGEVYCITDGTTAQAGDTTTTTQIIGGVTYTQLTASTPEYQPLIFGNFDFAMMDNVAYQPGRGNWVIHEDGEGPVATPKRGNDLWDCLDDGADKDILSDGCVKIATINDQSGSLAGGGGAEWTGGIFDATGKRFFVSVQHAIGVGTTGTYGPGYAHGYIIEIDGWQ